MDKVTLEVCQPVDKASDINFFRILWTIVRNIILLLCLKLLQRICPSSGVHDKVCVVKTWTQSFRMQHPARKSQLSKRKERSHVCNVRAHWENVQIQKSWWVPRWCIFQCINWKETMTVKFALFVEKIMMSQPTTNNTGKKWIFPESCVFAGNTLNVKKLKKIEVSFPLANYPMPCPHCEKSL